MLLACVVQFDMFLEQLDVKTSFLHGNLDEQIYMSQPEGFVNKEKRGKCVYSKSHYMA